MTAPTLTHMDRQIRALAGVAGRAAVTTCYLDVDGRHRRIRSDCLQAFNVLAQRATSDAAAMDPALQESVQRDLGRMRRWIENDLDRSRTRGVVLVACSLDDSFHALQVPVAVRDQIVVSDRPHVLQLESMLARAKRYGVALIDHEKLRMLEYRLGELMEYPALFEGPAPHREREKGWNVTGASPGAGDAGGLWEPAGSHVDRREVNLAERHVAACTKALVDHLDRHPVDHLLLGGPEPERAWLERTLPEKYRSTVAGQVSVRVTAPLSEISAAMVEAVQDIERSDEVATLRVLDEATGRGQAVRGFDAVLGALADGRVGTLILSASLERVPGAQCSSCGALALPAGECPRCGASTTVVDDVIEAAVERATGIGATERFVSQELMPDDSEGMAAITRF